MAWGGRAVVARLPPARQARRTIGPAQPGKPGTATREARRIAPIRRSPVRPVVASPKTRARRRHEKARRRQAESGRGWEEGSLLLVNRRARDVGPELGENRRTANP